MIKKSIIIKYIKLNVSHLLRFAVALFVILVAIRFYEFYNLISNHTFACSPLKAEILGLFFDFTFVSLASIICFLPALLLLLIHRNAATIFLSIIALIIIISSIILSDYFIISVLPLDQVLFTYTKSEIYHIIGASNEMSIFKMIAFIGSIALFFICFWTLKKITVSNKVQIIGSFLVLSGIILFVLKPMPVNYFTMDRIAYYIKQNKIVYLVYKANNYLENKEKRIDSIELSAAINEYRAMYPQRSFIEEAYPFAYKTQINNTIGRFFAPSKKKPNIVIIIGESFSRTFLSPSDSTACVMPFLDSLKNKSLYWDNFISTANRTFNVLPAVTGSLPFGKEGFAQMGEYLPTHHSMLSILRNNDYYTSFYYGGWLQFDNMDSYLRNENIDYILNYFPRSFNEINEWGYSDGNLLERSFEVIDSIQTPKPRLDVFLTLSMHHPFEIPRASEYSTRIKNIINTSNLSDWYKMGQLRYAKKLSTCLYTDDMLRQFFEKYKTRPDYENTIFLIMGDHSMDEISYHFSGINKFRVPLIIYSPMLTEAKTFHSVCSHLDITPTLLSFLADKHSISLPSVSHWIGEDLDTSTVFIANRFIPTILNDRSITEFIHNNHFLSLENRSKQQIVSKKLRDYPRTKVDSLDFWPLQNFIILNNYACNNNKITPEQVYAKDLQTIVKTTYNFENKDNGMNSGQKIKTSFDTIYSGNQSFRMGCDIIFFDLLKKCNIQQHTKYCFIDVKFKSYANISDIWNKIRIVLTFESKNNKLLHYEAVKPLKIETNIGVWQDNFIRLSYDVRNYTKNEDTFLNLYLWNKENILSYFDDIQITVKCQ